MKRTLISALFIAVTLASIPLYAQAVKENQKTEQKTEMKNLDAILQMSLPEAIKYVKAQIADQKQSEEGEATGTSGSRHAGMGPRYQAIHLARLHNENLLATLEKMQPK